MPWLLPPSVLGCSRHAGSFLPDPQRGAWHPPSQNHPSVVLVILTSFPRGPGVPRTPPPGVSPPVPPSDSPPACRGSRDPAAPSSLWMCRRRVGSSVPVGLLLRCPLPFALAIPQAPCRQSPRTQLSRCVPVSLLPRPHLALLPAALGVHTLPRVSLSPARGDTARALLLHATRSHSTWLARAAGT